MEDILRLWPVSRAINILRNDEAELLDRTDHPAAPPPSDAPARANPPSERGPGSMVGRFLMITEWKVLE